MTGRYQAQMIRDARPSFDGGPEGTEEIATSTTILRGVVGSTVHGLNLPGHDDRDEMGICVEPIVHFFGLRARFEQWVHRTQPQGVRSGPGDLDLTIYSLAKWAKLAVGGNPSVLLLLFVPRQWLSVRTNVGRKLQEMAPAFVGDNIFGPYLGYIQQQRDRLTNKVKMPNRPELIAAHGWDTKYGGHIIRLGYQGIELASTGRLELPMREPERSRVLAIRRGEVPEAEVLDEARELEELLKTMRDERALPPVDIERIEDFVFNVYMSSHTGDEYCP